MRADQIKQQIAALLLQYPELAEDEQLRADMIEGSTDVHQFLIFLERRRQDALDMIIGANSRIAEILKRHDRYERRVEAMRDLMFKIMQAADLRKVEMPIATLSIANGQQHVVITDEAIIPDVLCRIKREPDRQKIKQMLKDGTEVRGAVLSNASPHLTIRTR